MGPALILWAHLGSPEYKAQIWDRSHKTGAAPNHEAQLQMSKQRITVHTAASSLYIRVPIRVGETKDDILHVTPSREGQDCHQPERLHDVETPSLLLPRFRVFSVGRQVIRGSSQSRQRLCILIPVRYRGIVLERRLLRLHRRRRSSEQTAM